MTDIITFILSFFFLILGAVRGFLQSLLVPFSIIVTTIISIIYYQITKDIIVSLLIGLLGPVLLNLALKMLIKGLTKVTNREIRPGLLSRMAGALLTLAWGWVFIVFALILLASLPPWGKKLTAVHNDVINSASYFFAKPLGERIFTVSQQNIPSDKAATSSSDAKTLAQDPRFLAILQDPEIQKEIDHHDIVHLMSNPKMMELTREIMSDPATMKKIMAIYSSQTSSKSAFSVPDLTN